MSQGSPPTKDYFLPEWVTGVFYGDDWYNIQEGSLKYLLTSKGVLATYLDPYSNEVVFVRVDMITGWRITQREFRPVVVSPEE